VSHQFLLNAHGCSGFVQPSAVGVTERVEPDPAKSQLETCRNQVVGANRICMIGPTGYRTWEQPAPLAVDTERLPFPQFEDEAPFDRDLVLRVLRFQFVEPLPDG